MYRLFGRTGVKVSCVGMGCGGFGGVGSDAGLFGKGESEHEAFALMDRAVELGINYFDTADSYGGGLSEEMVGRWLASRGARDQIVLSTKVFTPMGTDENSGGLSRRHILRAVEASLRRLRTDRIDIYLGHAVDTEAALEETVRAFDDVVSAGKVCYVGCSNIEAWRMTKALWVSDRLRRVRFECVQNEYNLLRRSAEVEMLPLVAFERLAFIAYSPLAGGWLTGKYREQQSPPPGSRMTLRPEPYAEFQTVDTYRAIEGFRAVAAEYGSSLGALALAWAFSHPSVTSVLAGPRDQKQFDAVAEAIGLRLTPDDRQRISDRAAAG